METVNIAFDLYMEMSFLSNLPRSKWDSGHPFREMLDSFHVAVYYFVWHFL